MAGTCDLVVTPFGTTSPIPLFRVQIESHSAEPWMAEDGATVAGVRISVTGTATLDGDVWANIRTKLLNHSCRLASATMTSPTGGGTLIEMTSAKSSVGGPYLKLTATEVIGSDFAVVRFELTDQTTRCDEPVIAHTWTQRFNIDPLGRMTRTIQGTARAARNATASDDQPAIRNSTGWDATKPWIDLFRRALLPDVPAPGWRRESQEFALDQLGTGLVYQVVDKQYAYDLPNGVRMGDMEFTYERNAQDAGIGVCRISIDLEGDQNLTESPIPGNRKLVAAAVELAKTRINATYANTIITRMQVTERNMLSGFSIRFELDAHVFPTSSNATSVLAPIAFMVGQRFKIVRTENRTMDPYGAFSQVRTTDSEGGCGPIDSLGVSYYMVPHYVNNILSGMDCRSGDSALPYALLVVLQGDNGYGDIKVYVCPDLEGVPAMNDKLDDGVHKAEPEQPEDAGGGTQIVSHAISTTNSRYDTGLVRMSPMYNAGGDLVLQTRKPLVVVSERIEVSRANTAPRKKVRALPSSAMLISENWDVAFGRFDAQGNRLFTGIYERKFALYDNGQGTLGFFDQISVYAGTVRAWKAPNDSVLPTISPIAKITQQEDTQSVFGSLTISSNEYPVNGENFVT